jgi:quinol-cytochrome oxidoreductase complex cytochrome b subunit
MSDPNVETAVEASTERSVAGADPSVTPVELSRAPKSIEGKRVLGVVPGKPVAGERKMIDQDDTVMVWPHLLVRHAVAAMGALLVVMIIAVLFDAPLREVANPQVTPNPEKAPWYFAALQELLSMFHPLVAGVLVPGAIVIGLVALPYIDDSRFIKPRHRKVAVTAFTSFMVIWIILTLIGFMFRGPNWAWVWPWEEWHGEL